LRTIFYRAMGKPSFGGQSSYRPADEPKSVVATGASHPKGKEMTQIPPTLSYSTPISGTCPLCDTRPLGKYKIYGTPVCKKCYYAFANRRQLAYLIDVLIWLVPVIIINIPVQRWLLHSGLMGMELQAVALAVSTALTCLFIMKDGFNGQSPGKRLTGVQVLDQRTGQPIGFGQSFKRNSILLLGQIPWWIGPVAGLVVILIIAVQVAKGYRIGDRFGQTRVIWKKYARLPAFSADALKCETCGYDFHGNISGVCPECGTAISEPNAERLAAIKTSTVPAVG